MATLGSVNSMSNVSNDGGSSNSVSFSYVDANGNWKALPGIVSWGCTIKFPETLPLKINKVIFNPPMTIVNWEDGSKTTVLCGENDEFDPEKGVAMCISKKALGNMTKFLEAVENAGWQARTFRVKVKDDLLSDDCFGFEDSEWQSEILALRNKKYIRVCETPSDGWYMYNYGKKDRAIMIHSSWLEFFEQNFS